MFKRRRIVAIPQVERLLSAAQRQFEIQMSESIVHRNCSTESPIGLR